MSEIDYDDPAVGERWCGEQRVIVSEYLRAQGLAHPRIGEWPAWHLAPYVSIWAIDSVARPGRVGWWVICGDLPTDYISSAEVKPPQHPRKAMRVFAEKWLAMVQAWSEGREHEDLSIAGSSSHEELAPLLESRARLLVEWAGDDSLWEDR